MESLWDRSKHAFDRILADSQKATERVITTLEELGEKTKARLEKARLQRLLLKRSAELGSCVYELSRKSSGGDTDGAANPLQDSAAKALLAEIAKLEEEIKKVDALVSKESA
jgi:hypothetical protein